MTNAMDNHHAPSRGLQDPRTTATVFSAVVAIVLAGVSYGARIGLTENSLALAVQTLSLSFFLLFFPETWRTIRRLFWGNQPETWVGSDAALSLIGLFMLPLAGIVGGLSRWQMVLPAMVTGGLLMFVMVSLAWLRSGNVGRSLVFVIAAGFFGTWAAGAVWGSGFQNPLYEEALAGGYYLCKDVLVVSSITSMLRTFDFPATGLDGLVYCSYHWGAYWFFAQLGELLHMNTMRFVQLGFPVLFIPFLLKSFLEFAIHAGERLSDGKSLPELAADVSFWVLVFVGWIGFVPSEAAAKMRFGENVIFYSESYCVALSLAFGTLSLSLRLLAPCKSLRKSLTMQDHCLIMLLPVLMAGVGLTKISLMFILVVIYGYLFLRLGLWRYGSPIPSLALSGVALLALIKLTSPAGAAGGYRFIYPFAFFVSIIPFAWKPFFFIFYYFWAWVLIVQRLAVEKLVTLSDLVEAMRKKTVLDAEVIVIVCIVGGAPAYILPIGGASGLFFMDFQWWLALGLILAHRQRLRAGWNALFAIREPGQSGLGAVRLAGCFAVCIGVCMGASVLANGCLTVWRMGIQNLSIRNALVNPAAVPESPEALQERLYKRLVRDLKSGSLGGLKDFVDTDLRPLVGSLQGSLEKAQGYALVRTLQELDRMPHSEKRKTLLFVPRSNTRYWELVPSCEAVSFLGPAIAGMAVLNGLPDPGCKRNLGHFDQYRPRQNHETRSLEQDEGALCLAAREKGFSRVIVLGSDERGILQTKAIACP